MDENTKVRVWRKGAVIPGYDPATWRRDEFGYAMSFQNYGDRTSAYGWEIDHVIPVSQGGSDDLGNLRPLHWRANTTRQ